jgi:hypothetical protein
MEKSTNMSNANAEPVMGEQGQDRKFEMVKATLRIAPDELEKLMAKIDLIRDITQRERGLIEMATEIDAIDGAVRADKIPTCFYSLDETYGRYYVLAPDTSSFPDFKGDLQIAEAAPFAVEFAINPIAIDIPLVGACTFDHPTGQDGKVGYGLVLDYKKPEQEIDLRILTSLDQYSAYDHADPMWDSLFGELEAHFPDSQNS